MTKDEAKALRPGDMFHSLHQKNANGTPMRMKVTSVKVWPTRPVQVDLHYKRGLYEYGTITERELGLYGLGSGE